MILVVNNSNELNDLITKCMPSRAGSPNKNKKFLLNRLQAMYGEDFHPIMKMAKHCLTLDAIADDHAKGLVTVAEDRADGELLQASNTTINALTSAKAANDAWERLAVFVEPKLKAIEHSGDINTTPTREMTYAELEQEMANLKRDEVEDEDKD